MLSIRAMDHADLDGVMQVENAAYEFPWGRGVFVDCLQADYPCWVAELEGVLVGHAIMTLAVGEAHVLNVCVDPNRQRLGIGGRLLDTMIDHAYGEAANCMFLEVRKSNDSALRLYLRRDFVEVGLRKGYYPAHGGREDAIVLRRDFE